MTGEELDHLRELAQGPENYSWLKSRTIYLTRAGSHAYGTNTATSDEDFRGVAIAPVASYLGIGKSFEQYEQKGNPDIVIYDFRKFVKLASQANPNILELLFTDGLDEISIDSYKAYNLGLGLINMRSLFVTKRARATFSGYATAQLKKIKQNTEHSDPKSPRGQRIKEFGYCCYSKDTEFLTESGWKLFDDVLESDKLATVYIKRGSRDGQKLNHRKFLGVEYQQATDRFSGEYTGDLYHLTGNHVDCLVTPNHRMLFKKTERKSGKESNWQLEEASFLPDQFEVLVAPSARNTSYSNQEWFSGVHIPDTAYLTLMGWYLSDGTAGFRGGRVKHVSICQKLGGKLSFAMARWQNAFGDRASSSLYEYDQKPNDFNPTTIKVRNLNVRDRSITEKLVSECGFKEKKRIPRWVFGLSKRLMCTLLKALLGGDGSRYEHKTTIDSHTYYSKSKDLADDVQELAMMCGFETGLRGQYHYPGSERCAMYQVHVRQESEQTRTMIRSANVEKVPVVNHKVSCFTVPNGTLITRRNGKISIHGNSKNAMHLVRLLRMCREILETGIVRVKRPDAEELLAIRNGKWTLKELCEYAENENRELDEVCRKSTLPDEPDMVEIDRRCVEIMQEGLRVL